jgi:hypothetical protein
VCKPGVEPSAELKLSSKESVGYVDNLTPYISSEENQISHQLRQENNREENIRSTISREENSYEGNITPPIVPEDSNWEKSGGEAEGWRCHD